AVPVPRDEPVLRAAGRLARVPRGDVPHGHGGAGADAPGPVLRPRGRDRVRPGAGRGGPPNGRPAGRVRSGRPHDEPAAM
ncbi:MAG: hypothetical protein AVDCRST_MAG64-3881, partial [uncultured Phycisphaerae bacterium]